MMQTTNSIRGLKHVIAPLFPLGVTAGFVYLSSLLNLPEELMTYDSFLLIFASIFALLFMSITVPCCVYGGVLAIKAIWKERRYVLPVITLLLDCAMLFVWGFALRQYFMGS